MKKLLSFSLVILLTYLGMNAQESLRSISPKSTFSIEGTSTLHNWTVSATDISGSLDLPEIFFQKGSLNTGATIASASVKVPVDNMDGGKDVMNAKMHRALLKETHPFIQFELSQASVSSVDAASGVFTLNSEGQLTIAGVTQPVAMEVQGTLQTDGSLKFTGAYPMKMSDHNIDPPTAMFGQIVTGDEVTVSLHPYCYTLKKPLPGSDIMMKSKILLGLLLIGSVASGYSQMDSALTPPSPFEAYTDTIPGTDISFTMTPIPGGAFVIGSDDTHSEAEADEMPACSVQIEPFYMGIYEVTFDMYEIFRDAEKDADISKTNPDYKADAVTRPSPPYEDPTFGMGKYGYPAVSMTQYAALMFCKWLSEKTGNFYRLATEAEWEYACRAGAQSAYSFGDDEDSLNEYGWYYENSNSSYHKVGEKKPNEWGLYDMHGNVAEWTLDQYREDYYVSLQDSVQSNPWSRPTRLHPRTVKGGSWDDDAEELRSANRIESSMDWKRRDPQLPKSFWWNTDSPFVGFRIVRPAKPMTPEEIANFWMVTLDQ